MTRYFIHADSDGFGGDALYVEYKDNEIFVVSCLGEKINSRNIGIEEAEEYVSDRIWEEVTLQELTELMLRGDARFDKSAYLTLANSGCITHPNLV